jgi:acetyl esterase/lipase
VTGVAETSTSRVVPSGQSVEVVVFAPDGAGEGPLPVLILSHGFARSPGRHAGTARWLAARGFVVVTPASPGWFQGDAQQQNIDALADHARWIVERGATPGDALEGRVDAARLALAGHSAGGAVSIEAAAVLATEGTIVPAAVVLLDGVPWPRTLDAAPTFPPIPLASLRAGPSSCNNSGEIVDFLEALPFPQEDVRVVGSNHCDQENPSDFLCGLACGAASSTRQERFRDLMHRFLLDAMGVAGAEPTPAYAETLDLLEAQGLVARQVLNGDLPPSGWQAYRAGP